MPEEKNGESSFKVVDRRSFSADGTRREGDPREQERTPEFPRRPSFTDATQTEAGREEEFGDPAADFETLVSYLSTTAMFQLGLLAGPGGERIPPDLVNAQRTINLLEVLLRKTRGNLTPDEQNLLEATLYELRLGFVEVNKRQAKKGK
jgi:uncharacterized protein DUF1844